MSNPSKGPKPRPRHQRIAAKNRRRRARSAAEGISMVERNRYPAEAERQLKIRQAAAAERELLKQKKVVAK